MAVLSNITLRNGLKINGVYLRVETISGNKHKVGFTLVPYQKDNLEIPLEGGYYYEFVPNQSDDSLRWDKQSYLHLKTLESFSDVIDC